MAPCPCGALPQKNNDLRIHENTLIPAEIARWKADDLRVDERADNSREHRPEKQFQNIFMDESRQSRARSGVNEHGGQDTTKIMLESKVKKAMIGVAFV